MCTFGVLGLLCVGLAKVGQAHDWPKSVKNWPKSVLAKVGLAKVGHDPNHIVRVFGVRGFGVLGCWGSGFGVQGLGL